MDYKYLLISLIVILTIFLLIPIIRIILSIRAAKKNQQITPVDVDILCKDPHEWGSTAILTREDLESGNQDIEKIYCKKCGLIPSLDVMLTKNTLESLKQQEETIEKLEEMENEANQLKQDLIDEYTNTFFEDKEFSEQREKDFKEGIEKGIEVLSALQRIHNIRQLTESLRRKD